MDKNYIALIPAYKPEDFLLDLIKKLKEKGFLVLIVDDGSGENYADLLYSHEVYSYYMIYAFVFPLVGGTLLFSILGLIKIKICSGTFVRNFYHSGVATLTVGSIVQGILDIYGTTNMLTDWYWRIGLLFIILSIVLALLARRGIIKSCDSL